MSDLDALAQALQQAEAERAADVEALAAMNDDELAYLAAVGDVEDPATDGIEDERCL